MVGPICKACDCKCVPFSTMSYNANILLQIHGQTPKPLTPAPTPTPAQCVDSDSGSDSSCQK